MAHGYCYYGRNFPNTTFPQNRQDNLNFDLPMARRPHPRLNIPLQYMEYDLRNNQGYSFSLNFCQKFVQKSINMY